jgi:hypothetical protein
MLIGMLLTVSCWLGLIGLYLGVGVLLARPLHQAVRSIEDVIVGVWLGWAASIAALQIVHLVAPIDRSSLVAFALVGVLGLWRERASLSNVLRPLRARLARPQRSTLLGAGGAVLLLLWVGNRAMGMITPQGDAGLYHVGAIRWFQSFPLLPGLGNVDGNFAYNSSLFVQLAMLQPFEGPPHFFHLGFPPLLLCFTALTLLHLREVVRLRDRVAPHRLLGCLWLGALLPYFFLELPSTGTDTTAMMLGMLVGTTFFRVVFERMSERELASQTLLLIAFSCVAVTIKLSFAFFGFFVCAIAVGIYAHALCGGDLRRLGSVAKGHVREIVLVAALVLVVLGPWAVRGVVQSGYLAFPSSELLAFDVDWRIPAAERQLESDSIKAWARYPFPYEQKSDAEVLASWDWLWPWLGRTLQRVDLFTVPMLLFVVLAPVALWWARADGRRLGQVVLYLAPPSIAFVLWFVTAPAERFGGAIFWLLGAGAVAALFAQASDERVKRRWVGVSLGFIAASSLGILIASALISGARYGWALFVPPGPEAGFHPIPSVTVSKVETHSGLIVHVPVSAEAPSTAWAAPAFCWDAPRPCTIYPKAGLELREPPGFAGGFRVVEAAGVPGVRCEVPRPEACTREFVPVCGRRSGGSERSYANACTACSDRDVEEVRPGACE